jgi:acyl-homoserine-lactone acylase
MMTIAERVPFVLFSFLLFCFTVPVAAANEVSQAEVELLASQVEVIRTEYGVPHIYADNLRAFGYALGYLQLEDYGERVPMGMVRNRGELARHLGRTALDSDFENRPYYDLAVEVYPQLGQDTRDVYEGFAAGVNRYVQLHGDEFPEWMRPDFDGYDVAALYVYRPSRGLMNRWQRRLARSENGPLPNSGDTDDGFFGNDFGDDDVDGFAVDPIEEGSSAWALAPNRTTSNAAILMRNPHLGWNAGYWEVHAVVADRLDFYGDFRIGGPLGIIGGFNRHLGFATTNNNVNRTEVYELQIDSDHGDAYVLDGRSIPIRRESMTLQYRDGDGLGEETRERVTTDLGPIVHRTQDHIYVLRTAEDGEFRAGEQFLRLIQATNLEEWTDAMRLRAHPGSNFTYADAEGNIFYIWNGAVPVRPHPAGEDRPVAVTRSSQIWTQLHELEDLPQLLNPPGGYLRDENNGPWLTNLNQRLDPALYPDYFEGNQFSLRSQHSVLLVGNDRRLSLEDVVELKHSYRMLLADRVKDDLTASVREALARQRISNTAETPTVAALLLIEGWDNTAAADSRGAVLFQEWWRAYSERFGDDEDAFADPWAEEASLETPRGLADRDLAVAMFPDAVRRTIERFGSFDVEWGEVHRVQRGEVDEPVGGCAAAMGCFRVLNFGGGADNRRTVAGGDGWVIAVEFTDPPRAYSVLGFGQSAKEDSAHYADQAGMFARGEMKTVAYLRNDVENQAVRRYQPGLE